MKSRGLSRGAAASEAQAEDQPAPEGRAGGFGLLRAFLADFLPGSGRAEAELNSAVFANGVLQQHVLLLVG